jgi:hypothetical protein
MAGLTREHGEGIPFYPFFYHVLVLGQDTQGNHQKNAKNVP